MKILLWLVVLLVIGGGAAAYFVYRHNLALAAEAPKVQTAKDERGMIKLSVLATGSIASNLDVDIKCKSSGEVIKLPYDISNPVKKGDLLMELDPIEQQRAKDLIDASLASVTANLNGAKATLKVAEMQLETDRGRADAAVKSAQAALSRIKQKVARLKIALDAHAATQEEYDQATTDVTTAEATLDLANVQMVDLKREESALEVKRQDIKLDEAQVRSTEMNLEIAQQHLDECKVYAPMDAVVSTRTVQIGNIIASAISNVGGGSTVMTISDLSHIFSLANVDESDIGKVRVGQNVNVTADAFPGKKFQGKVTRIATAGLNVSNVVTFQVQIEILDPKKALLKPLMTTNVEIIAAEKDDALIVVNEAVSHKKGKALVTIQKADGTTEERPVETGINDGDRSELISGVAEGDELVMRPAGSSKWAGGNRPNTNFNPMFGGAGGGGGGPRR